MKLAWYRRYGVCECWLVDPELRTIEVVELQSTTPARQFAGAEPIRSYVLPRWALSPGLISA